MKTRIFETEEAQRQNTIKCEEIKSQLLDMDAKAVRPLRAILTDCGTDENKEILKGIEAQAGALRKELSSLL